MSCNVCAIHCKRCVKLQIMNLSNGELEWVCSHLEHDVQIDRNFYRLQAGVVELAKVTKLFAGFRAWHHCQIQRHVFGWNRHRHWRLVASINIFGIVYWVWPTWSWRPWRNYLSHLPFWASGVKKGTWLLKTSFKNVRDETLSSGIVESWEENYNPSVHVNQLLAFGCHLFVHALWICIELSSLQSCHVVGALLL
jgi:hypothetical protein